HCLSWLAKHLLQTMQPRMSLRASWTSSVSMPLFFSSVNTCLSSTAVFPSLRALPLNATTFINPSFRTVMPGSSPCEVPVLDAVRRIGGPAEPLLSVRLVIGIIAFEPDNRAVSLKGQYMGGDAVQE